MKKIIKLKNTSLKIDNNFKEMLSNASKPQLQNSNVKEDQKFEEMQIFLEEFDV